MHTIDLSPFAGRTIAVELCHEPGAGGRTDLGYWGEIALR
jgi:hypothetical protein